jgi:transposase
MPDHPGSSHSFPTRRSIPGPALPSYVIEPIWEQFRALLPERDHPLGCHRSRVPERTVSEKLVQVLVFGCAYQRIADENCSATTLRRRRDEWIDTGVMDELREMALTCLRRSVPGWPTRKPQPNGQTEEHDEGSSEDRDQPRIPGVAGRLHGSQDFLILPHPPRGPLPRSPIPARGSPAT